MGGGVADGAAGDGGTTAAGVVVYAPRVPRPELPWLFELCAATGRVVALLPDAEDGPLHTPRARAPRRAYASLAAACADAGLDPARDLELRWWEGVALARAAEIELARLGRADLVVREDGGALVVARGETSYALRGAHALRRLVEALAARAR